MATLLSDNFDRANSTTVIGAPQIGPSPVVQAGVGGIISNMLYAPTAPATFTWDLGTPNVELSFTTSANTTSAWLAIVLGYVSATSYYQATITPTVGITLYKVETGGSATLAVSMRNTSLPGSGVVFKMHHRDGILRVYVDDVLFIRQALDVPITSNVHGVRLANANPRIDNLLGTDAPTITESILNGNRLEQAQTFVPAAPVVASSFAYLGRDTKLQDISEGA